MLSDYGQVGLLLAVAIAFPIAAILTSWLLGRLRIRIDKPNPVKEDTYECGVTTEGSAWGQFNFRYYFYALLFVIFDVEAVFLYPWAVAFRKLAVYGFVEAVVFVIILTIGLLYAWRKKALEWQ
jgi:NADH:ubiquinone oxidoreductase subunit 3 (subunit A)